MEVNDEQKIEIFKKYIETAKQRIFEDECLISSLQGQIKLIEIKSLSSNRNNTKEVQE